MNTQQAYNNWASQYDSDTNKTRDLEGKSLRTVLSTIPFESCLEIGCGTGKNTAWLIKKAKQVTAIDFSEAMLAKAKAKIKGDRVQFVQADITRDWTFKDKLFDLITFSLVLEHINTLDHIFEQAAQSLNPGGLVYIGELHPFKQYTGSKARFETDNRVQLVESFTHHISDFILAAKNNGLSLFGINEYFDDDKRSEIPRIIMILLKKD